MASSSQLELGTTHVGYRKPHTDRLGERREPTPLLAVLQKRRVRSWKAIKATWRAAAWSSLRNICERRRWWWW